MAARGPLPPSALLGGGATVHLHCFGLQPAVHIATGALPPHPGNVQNVITLHIVVLVALLLLCVTYLAAMMRPFRRMVTQETRRIAELLNNLPSEVDVDTLLSATLLADVGFATQPDGGNKIGGGGARVALAPTVAIS